MVRRLSTSSLAEKFTPLSLDELDRVAGGLGNTNQDPNQDPNNQITQTADGAAFEQAQERDTSPDAVGERFWALVGDFQADHDIDMNLDKVNDIAKDVSEGLVDNVLGYVNGIVGGLDPATQPKELAVLTTALLDRYADLDTNTRPREIQVLLSEPAFQQGKIVGLADQLMEDEPGLALGLLDSYADALQSGWPRPNPAATAIRDIFNRELVDVLSDAGANDVSSMLDDGQITIGQFRDAFSVLNRTADTDTAIDAYREMYEWAGNDVARSGDPAAQAVHNAILGRLSTEAAAVPQTSEALADAFSERFEDMAGLDIADDLASLYLTRAQAVPGGLHDFFENILADTIAGGMSDDSLDALSATPPDIHGFLDGVLADAVAAGLSGADLDALVALGSTALTASAGAAASWQMVDILLDVRANAQTNGYLATFFAEALQGEPNQDVLSRLLAENAISPGNLAVSLLQHYDAATDRPAEFQSLLRAIAAEAGGASAAFSALIPQAVFAALIKEAADGVLDTGEVKMAADMVLANHDLPFTDMPKTVVAAVIANIADQLTSKMMIGQMSVTAFPAVLRDLNEAGPEAIGAALARILSSGKFLRIGDLIDASAESPGMAIALTLEVAARFDTYKSLPDTTWKYVLDVALGDKLRTANFAELLSDAVESGQLDAARTYAMIDRLAAQAVTGGLITAAQATALAEMRKAEFVIDLIEAGTEGAESVIAELKSDLVTQPSPVIAAVVTLDGSKGVEVVLQQLIRIADGAEVDIGQVLALYARQTGTDIKTVAASALAGLIATGEFTAEEAMAAARSVYSQTDLLPPINVRYSDVGSRVPAIAAEYGVVRLVEAAIAKVGADIGAATELRELIDGFRAEVASGEFARGLIQNAALYGVLLAPAIVGLLNETAKAADVFSGSLFLEVLEDLGPGQGTMGRNASDSWQFRDALRGELERVLVGNAAVQANWVAALTDAIVGGQPATDIVAELERIVEHAFARESLANTNDHWNIQANSRLGMRAVWDGVDRLVAATGLSLLANAGSSAAAREDALEWFRAQTPSGQAAILAGVTALPATAPARAELATLQTIAGQSLDALNWAAEAQRVQQTIVIGSYNTSTIWSVFKDEQGRHDLRGAVSLAGMIGESQIEPIIEMARAWGAVPMPGGTSGIGGAIGLVAFELLNSARTSTAAMTNLVNSLVREVTAGEATAAEIDAQMDLVIRFADTNARDGLLIGESTSAYKLQADQWRAFDADFTSRFTQALTVVGQGQAASAIFMTGIRNGSLLAAVENDAATAVSDLNDLLSRATATGVSPDFVLAEILERDLHGYSTEAAIAAVQARLASGATIPSLAGEVIQGDLPASEAIDALREIAEHTNRSFGQLVAGLVDYVESRNTATYAKLGTALAVFGVDNVARMLGDDVADGRLSAPAAMTAVLEIVKVANGDLPKTLGTLVSGAKEDAAVVAAEVVKNLDDLVAAKEMTLTAVAGVLGQIRATLTTESASLVTGDAEVLRTLATFYLAAGVRDTDIAALIDRFDGTNPDESLIALWDFLDGLPDDGNLNNNNNEDALQLIVAKRLADRMESGALFADALKAMEAVYYDPAPWSQATDARHSAAYQHVLDTVEKVVTIASYVDIYQDGRDEVSNAQAHAFAEDLVGRSVELTEARGAFLLFQAARDAHTGTGQDFMEWVIGTKDEPSANRDIVLGGLALYMTGRIGADGTLSTADRTLMSAIQEELMMPEYSAHQSELAAAFNAGSDLWPILKSRVAGEIALKVGNVMEHYTDLATGLLYPDNPTAGQQARPDLGRLTAEMSVAYNLLARTICVGGPTDWAIAAGLFATQQAMQVEAIRSFLGPGLVSGIDAALRVIDMSRAVLVETVFALSEMFTPKLREQLDAAGDQFYSGLSTSDFLSASEGLWKMVAAFMPFDEGVAKAIQQLETALTYLKSLMQMDEAYQRSHRLGISFL